MSEPEDDISEHSTLEGTEDASEESEHESDFESDDGDCRIANALMEAAENGNYDEFKDLAIGAEEFMLNWSMTVAKTVDIVRFLVEEKDCKACLGECYMNATQKGYTDVVEYIESLQDQMEAVINDTVAEAMTLLTEVEDLIPRALMRLMQQKFERGECVEEDLDIIRQYQQQHAKTIQLMREHFSQSVETWEKENKRGAERDGVEEEQVSR